MINLPIDEDSKSAVINTYNEEGFTAAAFLLATQLEKQDHLLPMEIAQAFILSNNHSRAMDWLEKGYENQDANIPYLGLTMFSKGQYKINDPRYIDLLNKMNLPLPN
jgi:hypothetical protein